MKNSLSNRVTKRKKKNLKRLAKARRDRFVRGLDPQRVIGDINIKYELADRTQAINHAAIAGLLRAIDEARLNVWKEQNHEFFDEARIDADGVLVNTLGKNRPGNVHSANDLTQESHTTNKRQANFTRRH